MNEAESDEVSATRDSAPEAAEDTGTRDAAPETPVWGRPSPASTPDEIPNLKYLQEFKKYDTNEDSVLDFDEFLAMQPPAIRFSYTDAQIRQWFNAADVDRNGLIDPNEFFAMYGLPPMFTDKEVSTLTDTDDRYERTPWWRQGSYFSEKQRKDRRSIFMHDDWVRHRSSERFLRNMLTIGSSGINQALANELSFVTTTAAFVVAWNMLFFQYQDFDAVVHPGLLTFFGTMKLGLPALPFSLCMPALALLITFRCNTAYARWNEARTLWGGLINNCRNVVRQTNGFFPDDEYHNRLKTRMAVETQAFIRCLRNFLRGPTDDVRLRSELYEMVDKGLMSRGQADATMGAANRPIYCLNAMGMTLRKADVNPINAANIDKTISVLVDLTGANERIFKSPIPLVYTRLTSRFLTTFMFFLPVGLWPVLGDSWNHWFTIPATFGVALFLFGIEEVGIQIEEPFSVLPLEAFCNGAINAANEEMLAATNSKIFDTEIEGAPKPPAPVP